MASRLRLTARAAGDQVIYFLDDLRREELRAAGVDVDSAFPERPYLQADYCQGWITTRCVSRCEPH